MLIKDNKNIYYFEIYSLENEVEKLIYLVSLIFNVE